jgi:hypothetical protein
MSATSLPLTTSDLPTYAPTGYSADGVAEAPRTIDGWAPAAARSTPADMARFARASRGVVGAAQAGLIAFPY